MKTPWHYLTWAPPLLDPKAERNLAAMTRSKGWVWAVLLFWGLPDGASGVAFGKVRLFVEYNYSGILAGAAVWLGFSFGRALLYKSAAGRTTPIPRRIYHMRTVCGVHSAVKRFKIAAQI